MSEKMMSMPNKKGMRLLSGDIEKSAGPVAGVSGSNPHSSGQGFTAVKARGHLGYLEAS